MTPEQQKEEISKAYVSAVAAQCLFKIAHWSQDSGCVDLTLAATGVLGDGTYSGPKLDIQMKCTNDTTRMHDKFVSWKLDRDHYDILRTRAATPTILLVLTIPNDVGKTIEVTVNELIVNHCAFWIQLTGMPAIKGKTKTVRIPKTNIFSPAQLLKIMTTISRTRDL